MSCPKASLWVPMRTTVLESTEETDPALPRTAGTALGGRSVLILVNSDGGGGVELLADIIGSEMVRLGAHVDVRFVYPDGPGPMWAKLGGAVRTAGAVLRRRPDVVIAFQPTSAVLAGVLGRLAGCRARIIHQSNMPASTHVLPRLLDRLAGSLGFYTCNIANSAATEAAFAGYPATYRRRMLRIDHGISWRPPRRGRADVLAGLGVPDDQPVILSCARLVAQKSLHTVVEALADLERGRFLIVGRGPEGDRLKALAVKLGVANRVHFLGHIDNDELPDIYAASDVFAFPSLWETFGLALVEAAFQGLPIVASRLPTTLEVLEADHPGPTRIVPTWDAKDWTASIRDVLEDPTAKARGQDFALAMRERHSNERMLARYRELFRELIT